MSTMTSERLADLMREHGATHQGSCDVCDIQGGCDLDHVAEVIVAGRPRASEKTITLKWIGDDGSSIAEAVDAPADMDGNIVFYVPGHGSFSVTIAAKPPGPCCEVYVEAGDGFCATCGWSPGRHESGAVAP
jgi:hypothetical protein